MIPFAIVLLACLPTILAQTHASRCPGIPGAFNVHVAGCINQPCLVEAGGSADTRLWFLASRRITLLTPEVLLTLPGGIVVPYPLPIPDQDGCNNLLVGSCPLHRFEFVIYDIPVTVDPSIPPETISGRLTLYDQHGWPVVCNSVNITVT